MKKKIFIVVLLCFVCHLANAAEKLLFFADFNKDSNAVYAKGSPLSIVHNDSPDNYPDITLTEDGAGRFLSSHPNRAFYNPNTDTEFGNPATNEYLMYSSLMNFNYKSGTFAAWVKPTQLTRYYEEGRIIGVGDHPLGFGNSWFLWDYDGYDSRVFSVGGTDGNGNQCSVSVALDASNGYDSSSVRDRWFFVAGSWEFNPATNDMSLKISVRDQYASNFTTNTVVVPGMTSLFNEDRPLLVGSSCFETGNVWGQSGYGGLIDWAQIYDGVLDDANVAVLYNETVESIAQTPVMPRLTFMATFDNPSGNLDADYAYVSKTSTVTHDLAGTSPDITQSPDGSGKFPDSTNNKAFYNPNSAFWDGIQFDGLSYEFLKYPAEGNFRFDKGTFVMWYKPMVYRPLLDALLVGNNVHWSYTQSWYLVHRQKSDIGGDPNVYPVQQLLCFYGCDSSGARIPTVELNVDDGQSASKLGEWIFIVGTWQLDAVANKMTTSVWYRKAGDTTFHFATMDSNDPNNSIINPNTSVSDIYVGSAGIDGRNGIGGYIDRLLIYDGPITYYGQLEKLYLDTIEMLPNPDTCVDVASRGLLMATDLNEDCNVDMQDVQQFATDWLECNDPQNELCLE